LASIGLGFQQEHYGLFLVAALGGLAFWVVEATSKAHQMRYYPRMGDIEVAAYNLFRVERDGRPTSSPLVDWGWYVAPQRLWWQSKREREKRTGDDGKPRDPLVPDGDPAVKPPPTSNETTGEPTDSTLVQRLLHSPAVFPHVMFPHVIALVAGSGLFVAGLAGAFGPI
jgi:hypothetical protein